MTLIAHSREPERNVMLIAEAELERGALTRTGTKVARSGRNAGEFSLHRA